MLTGKNIYKRYGSLEVLKGVNLEINKGEVVAIVGPSGCGKSTLLHILGSLDKANMGEIVINNTALSLLSGNKLAAFRNKHIGFVFQFHHLLPEFTALENVCIPGWIAGRRKKVVETEATKILQMIRLSERLDNKPNALNCCKNIQVALASDLIHNTAMSMAVELIIITT